MMDDDRPPATKRSRSKESAIRAPLPPSSGAAAADGGGRKFEFLSTYLESLPAGCVPATFADFIGKMEKCHSVLETLNAFLPSGDSTWKETDPPAKVMKVLEEAGLHRRHFYNDIYDYAMQFAPKPARSFVQQVHLKVKPWIRRYVVGPVACIAKLKSRHIEVSSIAETAAIRTIRSHHDSKVRQLTVVSGESGSGKTVAAIGAAVANGGIVIYARASAIVWNEKSWGDERRRRPQVGTDYDAFVEARHRATMSALTELFGQLSKNLDGPFDVPSPETSRIILVLDELGETPELVRALVRGCIERQLEEALASMLKVSEVRLVAAGTGCDAASVPLGSENFDYHVVPAAMAPMCAFDWLMEQLSTYGQLVEWLRTERVALASTAGQALQNFRVAAAFLEAFDTHYKLLTSTNIRAFVDVMMTAAMARYKELNGLQRLVLKELNRMSQRCLYLMLSRHTADLEGTDIDLVRRLGVLTDRAEGLKHKVPDDGARYTYSGAQCAMMRLGYGTPTRQATGDGFEESAADMLLYALLIAPQGALSAHGRTTRSLIVELQDFLFPPGLGDDSRSISRVEIGHGSRRIEPLRRRAAPSAADAARMAEAAPPTDRHKGVVLINAPRSHFADVIVWTPRAVLLVQLKRYESTNLSQAEAMAEFFKMGYTSQETLAGYIATNRSLTGLLEIADKLPATAAKDRLLTTLKAAEETGKHTGSAVVSKHADAAAAPAGTDDAGKATRVPGQEAYSDLSCFTVTELLAAIVGLPDKDDTRALTAIITDHGRLAARYVMIVYGVPPEVALPAAMQPQCRILHIKPEERLTAMYPVVLPQGDAKARRRATYEVERHIS